VSPATLSSIAFALSIGAFASIWISSALLREAHRREWISAQVLSAIAALLDHPDGVDLDQVRRAMKVGAAAMLEELDRADRRP